MGNEIILASIGIFTFMLILFFFKLGENKKNNHFFLQLIMLSFIMSGFVLIGKVALDSKENCSWLPTNSTTLGDNTDYTFAYLCSPNPNNTSNIFYNNVAWLVGIFGIYVFIYAIYQLLIYFKIVATKEKEGDE